MRIFFILSIVSLFITDNLVAQTPNDTVINMKIKMKDAVLLAQQNYHLLKSEKYESEAALKNVDVVKYSRLPIIYATY